MAKVYLPEVNAKGALRAGDFMHAVGFKVFGDKWSSDDIKTESKKLEAFENWDDSEASSRKTVAQLCIVTCLANDEISASVDVSSISIADILHQLWTNDVRKSKYAKYFPENPTKISTKELRTYCHDKAEEILNLPKPPASVKQKDPQDEDDDDDGHDIELSDLEEEIKTMAQSFYEHMPTRVIATIVDEYWEMALISWREKRAGFSDLDWPRSLLKITSEHLCFSCHRKLPNKKVLKLPHVKTGDRKLLWQQDSQFLKAFSKTLDDKNSKLLVSINDADKAIVIASGRPIIIQGESWGQDFLKKSGFESEFITAAIWRTIAMHFATASEKKANISNVLAKVTDDLENILPGEKIPSNETLRRCVSEAHSQWVNKQTNAALLLNSGRYLRKK
jgi:hypothetical protein